jgi:hypothetical protein
MELKSVRAICNGSLTQTTNYYLPKNPVIYSYTLNLLSSIGKFVWSMARKTAPGTN